ncbi:MAG: nucleotide exchange factor GrpE [Ruminococcus sp.]|uniref:Protein GrpE n=1 Tax=Ruminococcus albus TaxID=1264 RepID=A0A1H7FWX5_RUMAL|nr:MULTISPECIES: nucleotide exchange factor GrpE [Ruminococcus]MBO4865390.1 nucleotide exchange factor GrpE [Ruminococcus sp.]SEK28700.1 molecular chaperone GrpE [Ruminococcus albus]
MAFEERQDELEEEAVNAEETAEDTAEDTEKEENNDTAPEEENTQSEEEKLKAELADTKDKYLRLMAEYDNFRKRSAKERLDISASVKADTVADILPVMDNFERALGTETQDEAYKAGIEMIFKQFSDAMTKLGIEAIDPVGEVFDPNIANAVNQIEDPELGENVVAQVFQKGYRIGDKVIRYAMVVVANP